MNLESAEKTGFNPMEFVADKFDAIPGGALAASAIFAIILALGVGGPLLAMKVESMRGGEND